MEVTMMRPSSPSTLVRGAVAGAAAFLIGCSDPTGPVELAPTYRDVAFSSHVVDETETHLILGLSQVLELQDEWTAVRRTYVRRVDKATLEETIEEYVLPMVYELHGDRLRTSPVFCRAQVCPLILLPDPPDYLVRDGGQALIELTAPDERRTYTPFVVTGAVRED